MRVLSLWLLALALTGCAAFNAPPLPDRLPAPGSTLVLLRDLEVPPGMARVHIQHGRVVSESEVDEFEAYCQFMTRDLSTARQPIRIEADRFPIVNAWLRRYSVALDTLSASVGAIVSAPDDVGGPSKMTLANDLELASPRQPGVYRLSCRYWADPIERHLYLREIREALAGIAEIRPAGSD